MSGYAKRKMSHELKVCLTWSDQCGDKAPTKSAACWLLTACCAKLKHKNVLRKNSPTRTTIDHKHVTCNLTKFSYRKQLLFKMM